VDEWMNGCDGANKFALLVFFLEMRTSPHFREKLNSK